MLVFVILKRGYLLNFDEYPEEIEAYCNGFFAAHAPRSEESEQSVDETTLMSDVNFWRGYFDVRATVSVWEKVEDGKKKRRPSFQASGDPAVLSEFADFLVAEDKQVVRRKRDPDPFLITSDEFAAIRHQVARGRLASTGDLAQKIIWHLWRDSSLPHSPRHEDVAADVIYTITPWERRRPFEEARRRGEIELTEAYLIK